jgi:hypothetical protein
MVAEPGSPGFVPVLVPIPVIRAGEVRDNVEADSINVEKYVKELAALTADLSKAAGRMFEQLRLMLINMVSAIHAGGSGRSGGGVRFTRGIIKHKVTQNLWAVSGGKACSSNGTKILPRRSAK